jgi:hypothetical protein
MPVFPKLLSLAIVLELRRKNCFDVLWVCGQKHALADASLNCVSPWSTPFLEHANPHCVCLIFQGKGNDFIRHVQAIGEICLSNWRSSAELADSRIDGESLYDPVAQEQEDGGAE